MFTNRKTLFVFISIYNNLIDLLIGKSGICICIYQNLLCLRISKPYAILFECISFYLVRDKLDTRRLYLCLQEINWFVLWKHRAFIFYCKCLLDSRIIEQCQFTSLHNKTLLHLGIGKYCSFILQYVCYKRQGDLIYFHVGE